jgi:heat-inducible transcriptional repressor
MELDERKRRILQAIVLDYVATAEPVGSHALIERHALGVKSATIRNEMAELEGGGFLRQPHTSAGRVPAVRGYRYFVNFLMPSPTLPESESRDAEASLKRAAGELEATLRRTCQLLAQLTQLPAIATPPGGTGDTHLKKLFVTAVAPGAALLVLLFSSGRTENRVLTGISLDAAEALSVAGALEERFGQRNLRALARPETARELPPPPLALQSALWRRIATEIQQVARTLYAEAPVFVEGTPTALRQPEFRDVERLEHFLALLQERAAVVALLGRQSPTDALAVQIGDELGRADLSEYAVVRSPYFVGERLSGTIGVVGPTRMDYARASAAVQLMARAASQALTRLALA